MTNGRPTNTDIYNAINDFRKEMRAEHDKLETKVDANTSFRNQLTGKLTVIMVIIGLTINFLWDMVAKR